MSYASFLFSCCRLPKGRECDTDFLLKRLSDIIYNSMGCVLSIVLLTRNLQFSAEILRCASKGSGQLSNFHMNVFQCKYKKVMGSSFYDGWDPINLNFNA